MCVLKLGTFYLNLILAEYLLLIPIYKLFKYDVKFDIILFINLNKLCVSIYFH